MQDLDGASAESLSDDLAAAIGARLDARGSSVDASYLVEIGVARMEIADVDGALRRGFTVDARGAFGRVDDLLRRLENAIVRQAAERAADGR